MEPSERMKRLLNQLESAQSKEEIDLLQRKLELLQEVEK